MSARRKKASSVAPAVVAPPVKRFPKRPTKEVANGVPSSSFTPTELEEALIDATVDKQPVLAAAVHVGLARLISKASIAFADTTTWRKSVVRAACSAAGNRVRTKVRNILTEEYAKVVEPDDPNAEFRAAVGAIALHPMFDLATRQEIAQALEKGDVLENVKPILSRFGKTVLDALEILSSMVRIKASDEKEPEEVEEVEEIKAELSSDEEEEAAPLVAQSARGRPKGGSAAAAAIEASIAAREEASLRATEEEDEFLSRALARFEMTEYSQLDIETKCFVLQWLCDHVPESKFVHDTIEGAVQSMEAEEFERETLEKENEMACQQERIKEADEILHKLRERERRDYLYGLYTKEEKARRDELAKKEEAMRRSRSKEEKGSSKKSRTSTPEAKVEVDDDDDESTGNRARKKVQPSEFVGLVFTRTIYGVSGELTVKRFYKNNKGDLVFRCEYLDEAPLFEDLSLEEVRRPTQLFRCADDEFLKEFCSTRNLGSISEEQYGLLRSLFDKRWGPRISKDRLATIEHVEENINQAPADVHKNKYKVGMRVSTPYGFAYVISPRDDKICDLVYSWGGFGYIRLDQISASVIEPIVTGTDFGEAEKLRLAAIEEKVEKLRKMGLSYRMDPIAIDAFDGGRIFAKGNQECIVISEPSENFPNGTIQRCSKDDLQLYLQGDFVPNATHPEWEGDVRDLERKSKANRSLAGELEKDPTVKSGPFRPPIWLAPEVFHELSAASTVEVFQPIFHARFILERLESELRPWVVPSSKNDKLTIRTPKDASDALLDLEKRLMDGLGTMMVLQVINRTELNVAKPSLPDEPPEIDFDVPEDVGWSKRKRLPGNVKVLNFNELLPTIEGSLDEAWQRDDVRFKMSRSAAQEESPLYGWFAGQIIDRQRKVYKTLWDRAQQLRTQLVDILENKVEELFIKYSMDPVTAACCDGSLIFLLRWLSKRRTWRARVASSNSLASIVTEAIKLESATFELRRAGAAVDTPRDEVIRSNTVVCYSAKQHQRFLAEDKPTLSIFLSVFPETELYLDDVDEYRKVKVSRVDAHYDFSYVAIAIEDERESDDSDDEQEKRNIAAAAQMADMTTAEVEAVIVERELARRSRTNEDCVVSGCSRKAIVGNYGHCEVHRKLRRRGRPPTRAARLKREAEEAAAAALASKKSKDVKEEEHTFRDDDACFVCFEGGELVCCDFPKCGKVYHADCLGRSLAPPESSNQEVPWHCPLHRLPEGSRDRQVQHALLSILNGVAMLESAEIVGGDMNDLHLRVRDEERRGIALADVPYEQKRPASDLMAMRRRCICEILYKEFDNFNFDADALRERFFAQADKTDDSRLRETTNRIWKFMKIKAGRARVAIDGPRKETRHNSLAPQHRAAYQGEQLQEGQPLQSSGEGASPQQEDASMMMPDMIHQSGSSEKIFFDGEELDSSKFFERVEPGSTTSVPPGRALTNFPVAVEVTKATMTWPAPWDKCEKIIKIPAGARGKRKIDEFSMVEQFEPTNGEHVVMLYRDPRCKYLLTERKLEKAQVQTKAKSLSESLIVVMQELAVESARFDELFAKAERVWFLMIKRAFALIARGEALTDDEEKELQTLGALFKQMCVEHDLLLEQPTRRVLWWLHRPEPVNAGYPTHFSKRARIDDIKPVSFQTAFGANVTPSSLLAEYLEAAAAGHGPAQSLYQNRVPEADPHVIRVFDDMLTAVETSEESAWGMRKDIYVTLVVDGHRIKKPSGQRLVAAIPRALSERAPFYASFRVGSEITVKLSEQDESGWPGIVTDCKVDEEGVYTFDVKYLHDDWEEKDITVDRLILKPNPDKYFLKGTEFVAAAFQNQVRIGRMTKIERDLDEVTIHFRDKDEDLVLRAAQVRPLAWYKKCSTVEENARNALENKRQEPLEVLQQPISEEAQARPTKKLAEMRFVTNTYALGESSVDALISLKPGEREPDEIVWEAGDNVEVMLDHLRRNKNWRKAVFVRYNRDEVDQVTVKLDETTTRAVVTDRRLLRRPQPDLKYLPFEKDVIFVDAEPPKPAPIISSYLPIPVPPMVRPLSNTKGPMARQNEPKRGKYDISDPIPGQPGLIPAKTFIPPPVGAQASPLSSPYASASSAGQSPIRPNASQSSAGVSQMPPYAQQFPIGSRVLVRYSNQNVPGTITKQILNPQTSAVVFTVHHEINNSLTEVDISRLIPMFSNANTRPSPYPSSGQSAPQGGMPQSSPYGNASQVAGQPSPYGSSGQLPNQGSMAQQSSSAVSQQQQQMMRSQPPQHANPASMMMHTQMGQQQAGITGSAQRMMPIPSGQPSQMGGQQPSSAPTQMARMPNYYGMPGYQMGGTSYPASQSSTASQQQPYIPQNHPSPFASGPSYGGQQNSGGYPRPAQQQPYAPSVLPPLTIPPLSEDVPKDHSPQSRTG